MMRTGCSRCHSSWGENMLFIQRAALWIGRVLLYCLPEYNLFKPFLSLPLGTGRSKWINQVNLLICQNRINKQRKIARGKQGEIVEVWPQWLRRQFSQLETLRPNWLHTTAYCYTLNTTATATTSLLPQLYQTDKTNSSSPWEINLLWGGKGESLEQVFLWGKPLDHFEQIFHFDTSSKDHNR